MRYASFLRAINIGARNRIKMEDLRSLIASLGCDQVTSYLQTGNVLFSTSRPQAEIGPAIEAALVERGLRNAAAMVRSQDQLRDILAANPFGDVPETEGINRMVTLFREPLPPDAGEFQHDRFEVVAVRSDHVCWRIPRGGFAGVDPNNVMERRFKTPGTSRYWHVVAETGRLLDV